MIVIGSIQKYARNRSSRSLKGPRAARKWIRRSYSKSRRGREAGRESDPGISLKHESSALKKEYDGRGGFVMKNLFEAATAKEVKERIGLLGPNSQRQWGKMTAAQAMAHCSSTMEWAVGDSHEPRMFIGRIVGPLIKSKVLQDEKPMGRNAPTAKSLVVKDERDLGKECTRLSALVDRFSAAGPQGCTKHPHTFFGELTPEEWARLMYKHLDHHLRQFGA